MLNKNIIFALLFAFNLINGAPAPIAISEKRINELSEWFAGGMSEYQKDYDKANPVIKAPLDANRYTQTEADMKYLFDSNKSSFLPSFFNSIPKITSLAGFRSQEDKLIQWVLQLEEKKLSLKLQPNIAILTKNILNKERENSNDYVFYHAHNLQYGLIFDLYREIENFLTHGISIFNSEKYDKDKLDTNKIQLRAASGINFPYKNINEFIEYWEKYFTSSTWNDDATPELRKNIISTNLALFGNSANWGESSFYYFITSTSIASSAGLLDNIFTTWGFDNKYKTELNKLYENFMTTNTGHLLQVFIPAHLVDQYAFATHAFATPYRYKITNTFVQKYSGALNLSRHSDIKSILDLYRSGNFPIGSFDSIQARVVLMPSFFNPTNGIKMFRYTTSGLELEYGGDYRKGLRIIVAKMMINYILKKQADILNGNDLQLKQIFYEILQWADLSAAQQAQIDKDKADNLQKLKDKDKTDKENKEKADKAAKAKEAKDKADKEKADKEKEKITKQYDLGWKYFVNGNYLKAIQPLKESADQNLDISKKSSASDALATIYAYGLTGVNKNLNLAKQYATTAVNSGATWAQTTLDYINTEIKNEKAAKEKLAKEKAALVKAAQDKAAAAAKAKALLAAKAKQFKTTTDLLTKQANIIWQFKVAQASKKALLVKKLAPQVNKLKKDLVTVPVNIKNAQGQTPLMLDPRRAPIVYGLEKKKAKVTVNAKDAKGKSVLQYLIASPFAGNINLYRALINAGAKVNNNDIKVVQNKLKTKPKQLKPIVAVLQQGKKLNK
ncbi:MAG: hypothetical protein P4L22_03895 [Candidatus Babeliales bacterium]|nr:hypothetical protein [Candidatus Babeliales bacterium]